MIIFTIGYEGLSFEEFVSLLQQYEIDTVVDIRQLPLSRKPGFSKKAMAFNLQQSGIGYEHHAALGCPKDVRDQYKLDGSWQNYKIGFNAYLETQQLAIARLARIAKEHKYALLCFEADHNMCHRSLVARAVKELADISVKHIKKENARKVIEGGSRLLFA